MNTGNNRPRLVLIMAVVIIGVAFTAAAISSVIVTLWVLVVAVPVLATLALVQNVLASATPRTRPVARIVNLAIIGLALLAAGASSVMTVWTSSFGRFMYLEDLGVQGASGDFLANTTPVDRGLLVSGGVLMLLGAAALIAAVLARLRSRVAP